MLDPKLFRSDLEQTAKQLQRRGFKLDTAAIAELEAQRKEIQVQTQTLQNERNTKSKSIGQAKAQGQDIEPLKAEVTKFGEQLKAAEEQLVLIQQQIDTIVMGVPNILHDSVPDGKDEDDNVEVRKWGEPTQFDFEAKDHVDLGEQLGQMDAETAVLHADCIPQVSKFRMLHRDQDRENGQAVRGVNDRIPFYSYVRITGKTTSRANSIYD